MSVKKITSIAVVASALAIFMMACQSTSKTEQGAKNNPFKLYTKCTTPRPEICNEEYNPVCAKRDTGIRCVTTPCPSTKQVTKPNACAACSDDKVFGYTVGACPK